jgi:hypothetical protein
VFAVSSASLLPARLAPGDYVTDRWASARREDEEDARAARAGPSTAPIRDWIIRAAHLDSGRSLR